MEESEQFHFNPDTYLEMMISEVPAYEELEDRTAEATVGIGAGRILDLGAGTGETAVRVAEKHPTAFLLGIDESPEMLAHARRRLPEGDFRVGRLEDPCREEHSISLFRHSPCTTLTDQVRRISSRGSPNN